MVETIETININLGGLKIFGTHNVMIVLDKLKQAVPYLERIIRNS